MNGMFSIVDNASTEYDLTIEEEKYRGKIQQEICKWNQ